MINPLNTKKLRHWLLGKDFAEQQSSFFDILEKDVVFNNGMSQSKYDGLTRDELSLISLTQYKRYLEYGFPAILGMVTWIVGVGQPRDISRSVSCYIWQSQLAFTCSKSTIETPEQCNMCLKLRIKTPEHCHCHKAME